MPVYQLSDEIMFPNPDLAEEDGLLAVGGDLSFERLILAYCNGIFHGTVKVNQFYGGVQSRDL